MPMGGERKAPHVTHAGPNDMSSSGGAQGDGAPAGLGSAAAAAQERRIARQVCAVAQGHVTFSC